ncbi:hypothetical protein [Flavobacterium sp. NRK F7]|uniref:hypothetical protein n=1 Tax=Flavobacterium sp. NRK F7 TaxID=2954930 RepID=UPI00209017A3|nr:hypothetical protein [Flavobacterium sp. NRK F7]MCO6162513.1 hypothetical protein [Flavobacterium sp. NRK F7]
MKKKSKVFFFTIASAFFISCSNKSNDKLFSRYENEFNASIAEFNAKSFVFQYDGLTPQKSYFVNSKLKFLQYQHEPENGTIKSLVFFDSNSDKIEKIVRRKVFYEWDYKRNGNFSDTLFVVLYDKRKTYTYFDNKMIDSSFNKKIYEIDVEFVKKMKQLTEVNYKMP